MRDCINEFNPISKRHMTLKEACELIVDCPHTTAPDEGKGFPLVRTPNIGRGRLVYDGMHRVSEDVYNLRNKRAVPQCGDLIFAREAPAGNVAVLQKNELVCLGQRTVLLRPDASVADSSYLAYYLLSPEVQHWFSALANGATVSHINIPDLKKLEITLPPLAIQRRIAAVLGALDDKIELNRKMNANLEEQAQALFKSWFVDFDPWGGKMPEGWKTGVAEDFYTIKIGKTPPRKERSLFSSIKAGNVIWVSIADMGNCGMFASDSSEYLVPSAVSDNNVLVSPKGTVLLSFKLTVGRVAIADCPLSSNEAIAHFVPNQEICKEFTYFYLKKFNYEKLGSTSSIATAINSKMVKAIPFVVPDKDTLKLFSASVEPMSSMIRNNLNESRKLAELRDSLLPKLMSGELEVA